MAMTVLEETGGEKNKYPKNEKSSNTIANITLTFNLQKGEISPFLLWLA